MGLSYENGRYVVNARLEGLVMKNGSFNPKERPAGVPVLPPPRVRIVVAPIETTIRGWR